jgi:hypothetical protein
MNIKNGPSVYFFRDPGRKKRCFGTKSYGKVTRKVTTGKNDPCWKRIAVLGTRVETLKGLEQRDDTWQVQ